MTTVSSSATPSGVFAGLSTGQLLTAWLAIAVALQGIQWLSGIRSYALAVAVEQGAARTEQNLRGETTDEDALKAIRLQNETLTFWAILTLLYDLVLEPIWIVLRPFLAAVVVGAAAALVGREPPFTAAFRRFAQLQFLWLIGPTLTGLLTWITGQPADTSLRLLLPPGEYPAAAWVLLGKIDCFALMGWFVLVLVVRRHRWAPVWIVAPTLGCLWLSELVGRSLFEVVLEAGMRLTIIPS